MRRGILLVLLGGVLLGLGGAALFARDRLARCAYVPLLATDRLPTPDFARLQTDARSGPGVPPLPAGWSAPARGVQVGGFTIAGTGHSFQLLGIANALQAPPLDVRPGERYCVAAQALADSTSGTRLRVQFDWRDAQDQVVATDVGAWQDVRRWAGANDRGGWSTIVAGSQAPAGAARLIVSFHPASDDRVYLDDIQARQTTIGGPDAASQAQRLWPSVVGGQQSVVIQPWPDGYRAALSFSFDWETAMGGLIHSRSRTDDPNSGQDPLDRAMRMRAGVTTTLDLFRPYGIRATYYATGYNFLLGNTEKRQFMGNPTFAWATQQNRWLNDTWARTPWFASDPYGTAQADPAWYFGDLVPLLLRERQDIQSHTFSHMDGGLSDLAAWRADLATWNAVAAERGVAGARSLAFPWSSSAGMGYDSWDALEQAGISSVTRTNWSQDQYDLFGRDAQGFTTAPRCIPLPGHEHILACPDFYLTAQRAPLAIRQLDAAIAAGGMIDLWAHTEEVVSPEQIAAWGQVVSYAARQRDMGALWIAPLAEIAGWQAAVAELSIEHEELKNQGDASMLSFSVHNASQQDLSGVTLKLPFQPKRITADSMLLNTQHSTFNLNIRAGQTVEVIAWPA